MITKRGCPSPGWISPSTNPPQHSLDSLPNNSKSSTTFSPSALTPTATNRSGPKKPSIGPTYCVLFPISVFLLGLTLATSQFLFWDTERIRLFQFPQHAGRCPQLIRHTIEEQHPIVGQIDR